MGAQMQRGAYRRVCGAATAKRPAALGYAGAGPAQRIEEGGQGAFKVLAQQLAKRMGWAVPGQDFAWSVVEHRLHLLDLFSRELIEPRARGEKLAQQAIGVLVRAPLPGTMRVRKVDAHLRLLREEAVLAHFLDLVVRERAAELGGQRAQFAREDLP